MIRVSSGETREVSYGLQGRAVRGQHARGASLRAKDTAEPRSGAAARGSPVIPPLSCGSLFLLSNETCG